MEIQLNRKEVPVLLLTGYLGSGKTTLLNRILSNKKGIKFAVIVNDIGEVNIDESLIEKGGVVGKTDDSLVALQNGCICCTLKMDLVAQLADLTAAGKFDYIVIEASGICEPAPIAQTISTMPALAPQYTKGALPYVDCICTVVDALRMKDEFDSGKALEKEDIGCAGGTGQAQGHCQKHQSRRQGAGVQLWGHRPGRTHLHGHVQF